MEEDSGDVGESEEGAQQLSMMPTESPVFIWTQFDLWPEDEKERKLMIMIYSLSAILIILICTGIFCYCADHCCCCCPKAKETTEVERFDKVAEL